MGYSPKKRKKIAKYTQQITAPAGWGSQIQHVVGSVNAKPAYGGQYAKNGAKALA